MLTTCDQDLQARLAEAHDVVRDTQHQLEIAQAPAMQVAQTRDLVLVYGVVILFAVLLWLNGRRPR